MMKKIVIIGIISCLLLSLTIVVSADITWHSESFGGKLTVTTSATPSITINFAGNLSDTGGPKYQPPGETIQLSGDFSDGYYTNNSRQHEDWIYINCTITNATEVKLNWSDDGI